MDWLLGPPGSSTLLEQKVIGRLREGVSEILGRGALRYLRNFLAN
jgi:hypothetical protein